MRQLVVALVAAMCVAELGCVEKPAFICNQDADCSGGRCEAINACSFEDEVCPSGRRFGQFAPGPLANECVDPVADAGTDAPASCGNTVTELALPFPSNPLTGIALNSAQTVLIVEREQVSRTAFWQVSRATVNDDFVGAFELVNVTAAGDATDPWLSEDGLTLLFSSTRGGSPNTFVATRTDITSDFDAPVEFTQLTTAGDELDPAISSNSRLIFYTSSQGGKPEVHLAIRMDPVDDFALPQRLDEVTGPTAEHAPILSADRLTLYFASERDGSAGLDLYSSFRETTTAPYQDPVALGWANSDQTEIDPQVVGTTLYFSSDRDGLFTVYSTELCP